MAHTALSRKTLTSLGVTELAISMLDIDKWLGVFSFTVKLVSKIMSAYCAHTIDGLANGGKLPQVASPAFSNDC